MKQSSIGFRRAILALVILGLPLVILGNSEPYPPVTAITLRGTWHAICRDGSALYRLEAGDEGETSLAFVPIGDPAPRSVSRLKGSTINEVVVLRFHDESGRCERVFTGRGFVAGAKGQLTGQILWQDDEGDSFVDEVVFYRGDRIGELIEAFKVAEQLVTEARSREKPVP